MAEGREVVQMSMTGQSAGYPRPPEDAPQSAQKQSWKGYYTDPTQQPIHIVLNDAFYGIGGFAGDIDVSADNATKAGNGERYSYVDPMSSELQYRNRVKQTKYFNYFARMVKSVVHPVFSRKNIETESYLGNSDKPLEDDELMGDWMEDCTGTGTTYNATQRAAMEELTSHDAAYYAVTMKEGATMPSVSLYSAVDVIWSSGDDHGKLNDIAFNRGDKVLIEEGKSDRVVQTAIQFFMEKGLCVVQWWKKEEGKEWEAWNEPKSTGVAEMVVYDHIPHAVKVGEFVPTRPSMKSLLDPCLAIFQDESKLSWLYALHNLPTPYFWGKIDGAFVGAGQAFANTTSDPANGYAPAPDYMTIPTGLLTGSIDKLKFNLERLREIAKESGIETKTGAQAQSGYSKEFEFQATEEKLRGTVDRCKEMDKWVFKMFNLYTGRTAYTYCRTYPSTFYPEQQPTLEDFSEWVDKAEMAGLTATRNILIKKGIDTLLGRSATEKEKDIIDTEIDASTIETTVLG